MILESFVKFISNEDALELIKSAKECFVVWVTDVNAIISVRILPESISVNDRLNVLGEMQIDYSGPTKGRFLNSSTTTLETLKYEQSEIAENNRRIEIIDAWERSIPENLIQLLEANSFPQPITSSHGTQFIIKLLGRLRRGELTESQMDRLTALIQRRMREGNELISWKTLRIHLARLRGDKEQLLQLWERYFSGFFGNEEWEAFIDAVGQLRIDDSRIIDHLIGVVERSVMFGPRYFAMMALGKLGSLAGTRAADAIERHIYESSLLLAMQRKRILQRINESDAEWRKCNACYKKTEPAPEGSENDVCSICFNLEYIPISEL